MPINTNGQMWVYCVNVGQGDTTIIITPENNVIIIDAIKAKKVIRLLSDQGFTEQDEINHIVVSHPHYDHYSGVERLITTYRKVDTLTLTSLWRYAEDIPGYNSLINTSVLKEIPLSFVSGYTQIFPDESPVKNPNTMRLELLGPSNQFIENLHVANELTTNHRSIIARLQLGNFLMVIAGDAQMDTWNQFDSEQMLADPCSVLRAAHHGSANGTQFERIVRLAAEVLIVSSDPNGKDKLPDLIGRATFLRYAERSNFPLVALTHDTGTIKIEVEPSGKYEVYHYGESTNAFVSLQNKQPLTLAQNPTDWKTLTQSGLSP
jgi:competence protein ComEC